MIAPWLVIAAPLTGFLLLALAGGRLRPPWVGAIGVGASCAAAAAAVVTALAYERPADLHAWRWIEIGRLRADVALHVDPLTVLMLLVVTSVGALIHIYATAYMRGDPAYGRFFALLNLFLAAMTLLVLAKDLLLLYVGWEGVGLASYLLIGFWHAEPTNAAAAQKAFLVTRVGDAAFALALFLFISELGTVDLTALGEQAAAIWPVGGATVTASAVLVLFGAAGKSAQVPLHTWLPDAMVGPTPVSALIHAATMVTAGVYLVARTSAIFELAPTAGLLVAAVGSVTLLLGGAAALAQRDLKRILAYSTMSQLGMMFVALGAGSIAGALFHLVTHACFKALLFLAAGVVIESTHESDVTRLGGLRRQLPFTSTCFVVGAASLAGLPLVTAGFFSKEAILVATWRAQPVLWAVAITGSALTTLYAFRAVVLVFLGPPRAPVTPRRDPALLGPLVPLAVGAVAVGWIELPPVLADVRLLSRALGGEGQHLEPAIEVALMAIASAIALAGPPLAWSLYARRPPRGAGWALGGFGIDELYRRLVSRPYIRAVRAIAADPLDRIPEAAADLTRRLHTALSSTQVGLLRWYAVAIFAGTLAVLGLAVG